MGLKGQLEDLPLIDMLQIIAFSKKSGYLRVAGPAGRGAVVIENGRILLGVALLEPRESPIFSVI